MRKWTGMMLAAAIAASVAGCGPKTDAPTTDAGSQTTTVEATATEEVANSSGTEATDGVDGEESSKDGQSETSLEEIKEAVAAAYGDLYVPSAAYDETALEEIFGVPKGSYDGFVAEGPMISTQVETFVAVEAKKGEGKNVEDALNEYRDRLLKDTMQYPMNVVKIQASQVVRHGDYVFFVMLGSPSMEAEEEGEEAALEAAKESNQIGLDVIDGFFR